MADSLSHLADIFLSIEVIKVLNLVEVDESMVLKYRMTLRWKDSRLKFRNLKKENYLNTIGKDESSKIWYPKVIFYNTRDTEETKVGILEMCELVKVYFLHDYFPVHR